MDQDQWYDLYLPNNLKRSRKLLRFIVSLYVCTKFSDNQNVYQSIRLTIYLIRKDLFILLIICELPWNSQMTVLQKPCTMSQLISTDWLKSGCCFSFWVDCLGSVLPSFLPLRSQLCLSLVSWANSQRRGRWWAWTTSNAHQTLQPEDRQEPWSSAKLCDCLSSEKLP